MSMTEAEAKTKWCPFVRSQIVGVQEDGKITMLSNRDAAQLVDDSDKAVFTHNCIGSACMAWRGDANSSPWWLVEYEGKTEKWSWDPRGNSRYTAAIVHETGGNEHRGYCGLAGTP